MSESAKTYPYGAQPDADDVNDTGTTVKDKVADMAAKAKDKASDFGRQAVEQVDAGRDRAADTLENTASALHEKAEDLPGGQTVRSVAHSAAEKLESTAGYIREHDVSAMFTDVENLVRRNPGPSLLIAASIGFLIGRAFRED